MEDWTTTLESRLRPFSTTLTRVMKEGGDIELHCAMADPVAFGSSRGNLAGLGVKVRASGNRLSFQRDGITVQIFILTGDSVPTPLDRQTSIA